MFKKVKIAILATGGIDSTTLMYMHAEKNPTCITVDYGQKVFHIQEENLNYHIKKLGLPPLVVIKVNYPKWASKPGLFADDYIPNEEKPLEEWDKLRYSNFFIEGRNAIMVLYAMAYCSTFKFDELLSGYLYGEEEWKKKRSYKLMTGDNSPQFVDMMNLLSTVGFTNQIRFRAPFYEKKWDKEEVIKQGLSLGIDYDKTYSCYFDPPCGVCDNCLLRKKYLKQYEKRN